MNFLVFLIIPGIISFYVMRKKKSTVPEGQIDETPLSKKMYWGVLVLCLVAPLVAQAIFYYGWKKRLPQKAKKANTLGWYSVIFWIVVSVIAPVVINSL